MTAQQEEGGVNRQRSGRITLWPFILFALGMAVVGIVALVIA